MKKRVTKEPAKKRGWSKEKRGRVKVENEQMLAVLQTIHPKAFDRKSPYPLQRGIHSSIEQQLPAASKKAVQRFLRWWTNRIEYHDAVLASAFRYELDGTVNGTVEPVHLEHSQLKLKQRAAKAKQGKKRRHAKRSSRSGGRK